MKKLSGWHLSGIFGGGKWLDLSQSFLLTAE
jgi:hypothetical protein